MRASKTSCFRAHTILRAHASGSVHKSVSVCLLSWLQVIPSSGGGCRTEHIIAVKPLLSICSSSPLHQQHLLCAPLALPLKLVSVCLPLWLQVIPLSGGGCRIEHILAVKPLLSIPAAVAPYTSSIFKSQVSALLADLQAEIDRQAAAVAAAAS